MSIQEIKNLLNQGKKVFYDHMANIVSEEGDTLMVNNILSKKSYPLEESHEPHCFSFSS